MHLSKPNAIRSAHLMRDSNPRSHMCNMRDEARSVDIGGSQPTPMLSFV